MAKGSNVRGETKQQRQDAFIEGFLEYGTIRNGCKVARIDRKTVHRWNTGDDAFADRFAEAKREFGEKLEEVIVGIVLDPDAVKKSSEQKEELGNPVENQLTEILKRKGSDDTGTGEEGSR